MIVNGLMRFWKMKVCCSLVFVFFSSVALGENVSAEKESGVFELSYYWEDQCVYQQENSEFELVTDICFEGAELHSMETQSNRENEELDEDDVPEPDKFFIEYARIGGGQFHVFSIKPLQPFLGFLMGRTSDGKCIVEDALNERNVSFSCAEKVFGQFYSDEEVVFYIYDDEILTARFSDEAAYYETVADSLMDNEQYYSFNGVKEGVCRFADLRSRSRSLQCSTMQQEILQQQEENNVYKLNATGETIVTFQQQEDNTFKLEETLQELVDFDVVDGIKVGYATVVAVKGQHCTLQVDRTEEILDLVFVLNVYVDEDALFEGYESRFLIWREPGVSNQWRLLVFPFMG